jgi:putative zinc finger protein
VSHLHHKVSALIDGELSPNARTRALAHARSCSQCRQEIAETLEVKRRVNRLAAVAVSADLFDVVGSITLPPEPMTTGPRSPVVRRVFAGVGALSAVVIAVAYVVGAPQASQAKPVNPPVEEFAAEFAESTGQQPLSDPAVGVLDADRLSGDISRPLAIPSRTRPPAGAGPATGSAVPVGAPVPAQDRGDTMAAVRQLGRALGAPARVGYVGALVIQSFVRGQVESARVAVRHVPGQGTQFDVLKANGGVRSASFVADSADAPDAAHLDSLDALGSAYDLSLDGRQSVDGRLATVVTASQQGQVRARFWIDVATGVLLQRDLYTEGRLVRRSTLTTFHPTRHAFMLHLSPELPAPPTTPVSMTVATALNDKGWACPQHLGDHFQLSLLNQVDAGGGVMRAEYTDGLSRMSVFEERGSLDTSALHDFRSVVLGGHQVYVKASLPMVAVWESAGTVFTAVTDAPQQMVGSLISRLPHVPEPPDAGVTSRIGHGLSRLASALTP